MDNRIRSEYRSKIMALKDKRQILGQKVYDSVMQINITLDKIKEGKDINIYIDQIEESVTHIKVYLDEF